MKKLKKFFRRTFVLVLTLCLAATMFPSAFAEVVMPQWAIDAGWTEKEYLAYLEKSRQEEELSPLPWLDPAVFETPSSEAPYIETPYFETPYAEEEFAAENFFREEFPVEEVFFAEESVEEEFIAEVPAEEAFVEEAFVEEAPVEEAFVEEVPAEEAPVEEAFVEEVPAEEVPAEEVFVEEVPVEEVFIEEVPAEEAFVEEVFVEEVPVEEAFVEEAFVEEVPAEEAFVEEVFVEEVPVEEAFVEEAFVEEVPAEEAPVEEAFVEEVPAEEAPAEEVFIEEVPVEELFVEEVPVEEAFVEEVPVEEVPAEEVFVEEVPAAEEDDEDMEGYTVEFHGANEEDYVLRGDSSAPLGEVLNIIGHGDIDLSQIEDVVSSDSSLFSAERDENGNWLVKANSEFATNQSMTLRMTDGSTVEITVTDASPVAFFDGHVYSTLQKALDKAAGLSGGVVTLLKDIDSTNIVLNTARDIVIDFAGHTYNAVNKLSDKIAASFSGEGSVTLMNGTLESTSYKIETVVESSVSRLTIKDMLIKGLDTVKDAVLSIVGGDVKIEGDTSIDAGDNRKTAIRIDDTEKDANVLVNTFGVILGKVVARDVDRSPVKDTDVLLHNGYFSGEVAAFPGADVKVDGGNYLTDVSRYVGKNTDYASVTNPYGTFYSAGRNLSANALASAMRFPTFINVLKSDGSVLLPLNAAVKNSVRDKHFIILNGRPLLRGSMKPLALSMIHPMFRPMFKALSLPVAQVAVSVVDGADSTWYKGCKDGLCYELSDEVSYVTIDGKKVPAEIDGVYAELEAETFEALNAGTHTVRFVLTNGAVAATKLKVVPDAKVVWAKGSENGLNYEMTGKIAKVLIDHVKVSAEIDGKDASVSASILQDLKAGNHTVEFVLENSSHVVAGFTVK